MNNQYRRLASLYGKDINISHRAWSLKALSLLNSCFRNVSVTLQPLSARDVHYTKQTCLTIVQGWPDIWASADAHPDATSARVMAYKNQICFPYLTGSYFCPSNCSRLESVNHESPFFRKSLKTPFRVSLVIMRITKLSFLTLRRLMPYIYGAPILDVSRSHTTTQHSR